jgi:hemoglobin
MTSPQKTSNDPAPEPTLFEAIGGAATFERIVENFYNGVAQDAILRPMYPEDLTEAKRHTALFLMQYFGGPTTYSQERGHPRLRMRHAPFAIGVAERDAWVRHMKAAVEAEALPQPASDALLDYFERAATFLINQS